MAKVIINAAMSLDGFVAGPGDDLSWIFDNMEPTFDTSEHVRSVGAVIMGRGTHDVDLKMRPKPEKNFVYGGSFDGPVYVLSKERNKRELDPRVQFVSGDIRERIKEALKAAGGRHVVLLGPGVWQEALEAKVVDEILILLIPVLLGDGERFYSVPKTHQVKLELQEAKQFGRMAQLRFKVKKN